MRRLLLLREEANISVIKALKGFRTFGVLKNVAMKKVAIFGRAGAQQQSV